VADGCARRTARSTASAGKSSSSASTRNWAGDPRRATARAGLDAALDDDIGDDLLRLIFTACHPVLSTEARVALTLRLLGGLTTDEIARAFLCPEPTIAQRIVRAKKTLSEGTVPFEVPPRSGAGRAAGVGRWR
jgi:predicted RNA polymerase sigma factor